MVPVVELCPRPRPHWVAAIFVVTETLPAGKRSAGTEVSIAGGLDSMRRLDQGFRHGSAGAPVPTGDNVGDPPKSACRGLVCSIVECYVTNRPDWAIPRAP